MVRIRNAELWSLASTRNTELSPEQEIQTYGQNKKYRTIGMTRNAEL